MGTSARRKHRANRADVALFAGLLRRKGLTGALDAPRLEDMLALSDHLAPADRARLREGLRVRYAASGDSDGVVGSEPHRLRQ